MARSFAPSTWGLPLRSVGSDVQIGELSLRAESCRRKLAFYLDDEGQAVCQSLCPDSMWFPTLVTRITSAVIHSGRAVVHVDASLPLHSAIADVAFPGNELAGARLADITVVDLAGHRRTIHAELPAHLTATGTIAIALAAVDPVSPRVDRPATATTQGD